MQVLAQPEVGDVKPIPIDFSGPEAQRIIEKMNREVNAARRERAERQRLMRVYIQDQARQRALGKRRTSET